MPFNHIIDSAHTHTSVPRDESKSVDRGEVVDVVMEWHLHQPPPRRIHLSINYVSRSGFLYLYHSLPFRPSLVPFLSHSLSLPSLPEAN